MPDTNPAPEFLTMTPDWRLGRSDAMIALIDGLSKAEAIEVHRALFGRVGDTGRTSLDEYRQRIATADDGRIRDAIEAVRLGQPTRKAQADATDVTAAAAALAAALAATRSQSVDADAVRAIVAEAVEPLREQVANIQPVRVEIPIIIREGHEPKPINERTHPLFAKVCKLVAAGENVLLRGPAGCGKTYLAAQVARALDRAYGSISCSAGMSEAQVQGWLLPIGDGMRFEYVPAEFVKLYEAGHSLFLFDELDAADPNMLVVLNAATANGHMHVPQRHTAPLVKRGEGAGLMAAANTFGTGADALYVGRNQLDAATLDRWYVIDMTYDTEWERTLAPGVVVEWVHALRTKVESARLRRVVSTRMIQRAARALGAGIEWAEVKRDLLAGWTKDELAKVGE